MAIESQTKVNSESLNDGVRYCKLAAKMFCGRTDCVFKDTYFEVLMSCSNANAWARIYYGSHYAQVSYPVHGYAFKHESDSGFRVEDYADFHRMYDDLVNFFGHYPTDETIRFINDRFDK